MDKKRKRTLARRAKSFKEDILDILNLRSAAVGGGSGGTPAGNRVRQLPLSSPKVNGSEKPFKNELLLTIENLPSSISLNQHFTNEINKDIVQVYFF